MAKKILVDTQKLHGVLLGEVDGMRRDKKYCDFLIKVGPEEIPVHRNILAATSDYFDAMFSHPTRESRSGAVEMIGVDPECAMICVDHMYGKEVSILPEKYEPLMYAANLMQLHTLRDAIVTLLEADLDPKSFFVAKRISNMYGCEKLEKRCDDFATENFGLISQEEDFDKLDKSYIEAIFKFCNVQMSETEKLDALLRRIKFHSNRSALLQELLQCIDISNISMEHRRFVAENESLVSDNLKLYKFFCNSVLDSAEIVSKNALASKTSRIVIFDGNSGHLQCWNPRENTWKRMSEMGSELKIGHFSAVTLGDHIYVLMECKSVYRLRNSEETADWERMADMIEDHGWSPPAVVVSDHIFVVGSHVHCRKTSLEKFNPATNQWTRIKQEHRPFQCSALVTLHECIFSFGGFWCVFSSEYLSDVQKFDTASETWEALPRMKGPKSYATAVQSGDKILLIGGFLENGRNLTTVELFDPITKDWDNLEPFNVARSWLRAFAIDGCIYAVGGRSSLPHSIEKYDVAKNEWTIVPLTSEMRLTILESVEIMLPE